MASIPRPSAALSATLRRSAPSLAAAIALGFLLGHFWLDLQSTLVVIRFPFGLDYGEGIVWQQMRNIMRGVGYGPLGIYPAIVYHYPPVYHVTVGSIVWLLGGDELATGREVSWLSTLGTATIIGVFAIRLARSRFRLANVVCALFTALIFLSITTVAEWAPLMRVDMLACLFSVAGLAIAMLVLEKPRLVHAAALCFTLAVFTKQVSLAAPAAAFLGLIVVQPRRAWMLAVVTTAQSTALLLLMSWLTHGEFLRHIILYNINRFEPEMIAGLINPIRVHSVFVAFSGVGAFLLIRRLRALWAERHKRAPEAAMIVAALTYFALKTLMLAMVMKSGANLNYAIEWYCAVAMLAGVAIMPAIEQAVSGCPADRSPLLPVAVLLAIAVQVYDLPPRSLNADDMRSEAAKLTTIANVIRASDRPVISDDMTLLLRAGREVEWEPAIVAELGAAGRYDQAAFIRMVDQHRFGMFITEGDRGDRMFDRRYNPPVAAAIARAYPHEELVGRFTFHLPR